MMDDRKMNQLADDIHLVTAPVRIVADWIKILVFIAILPIVFIVSVVNRLLTCKPILRPHCNPTLYSLRDCASEFVGQKEVGRDNSAISPLLFK
jgi:hypothetical protein